MDELTMNETQVLPRRIIARFSDESLSFQSSKSRLDWEVEVHHPALGSFILGGLPGALSEPDVHALALMNAYKLLELLGAGTKEEEE
jgi:hypothetical protein